MLGSRVSRVTVAAEVAMSRRCCLFAVLLPSGLTAGGGVAAAQAPVATVEVIPARVTLPAGRQLPFRAVARDSLGREVTGVRVEWTSAPFDAASIEPSGVFHAHRQCKVQVVAVLSGKTGTAEVVIEPKPATVVDVVAAPDTIVVGGATVLRPIARTEDGEPLRQAQFSFRSGDDRVATVDQMGVVRGRSEGTAILAVNSGLARTDVRIEVLRNRVAAVSVTGPTQTRTGEVIRLRASALDTRNLPMSLIPLQWSVSGPSASVGTDGGFVAEQPGTYLVTAAAGAIGGTHAIRVVPRVHQRKLELVAHVGLGNLQAAEVWAVGEVAYLSTLSDRIYVFDIQDPTQPVKVDSLVVDARVINDISTTADGRIGVLTREGASSRRNGLVFLDLADPRHPVLLSEFTESLTGGVHSAFIDGRLVYATDDATGSLRIIDFEVPQTPREVGRWTVPGPEARSQDTGTVARTADRHLNDVQVVDGLAYLAYGRHGLVILDVGNGLKEGSPASPRVVGRFNYNVADFYPPENSAGTHAVFRYGRYVFLGDEVLPPAFDLSGRDRIPTLGRVHVLDVSDIEHPVKVAEYHVAGAGSHTLWVEDDVMYIGYGEGGLRAVDVSGELRGNLMAQGREIDALWTGSPSGFRPNLPMAWGARPHRGVIYSGDRNSGLWITRLTETPTP